MADQNVNNQFVTWNSGGTTFNAIKMNVTDTASAVASLLLLLQVGGTDKFKVGKDGTVTAAGSLAVAGSATIAGNLTVSGTLTAAGITGAVTGPAGATDNAIARYNGATGGVLQNSLITIDDTGNISGVGASFSDYITIIDAGGFRGVRLVGHSGNWSGHLYLNSSSQIRWGMVYNAGVAGSFAIQRYTGASVYAEDAVQIDNATGAVTINGTLTVTG
ncbi:hypothetical protein NL532_24035 [Mesorhizobium sp. C120A]|uniref:hypothetical protein n=1 Tax=unclassified Mesorhizobium TaxID=325217 RepID=UPI0003D06909|nr:MULTISPECIES: hypothetical protein [unclassified Mesorhizobium]ESZ60644.1 hypothetical protein X728_14990 [Mesorhizobium sp. L103C120A0]WJI43679.1 hypothetical protein NL532_24035 [Mesorhizobium sp. C120A]